MECTFIVLKICKFYYKFGGFLIIYSAFFIRNFKGTCSSVEMLKWYRIRERLGILVLDNNISANLYPCLIAQVHS